ncbi:MinD/ParA family ATP-binding protein [Halorarius halobius]|uniref:MinD/ParA family ATP-binding protein n=1 Tax=Halorarius halobius TaxID=2962671 RepID=UPI0020CBC31F|nr:hypothetical protein [Halorarius halobius]
MEVLGVVGAADTGTTTTAVDLAAALRREGHHAAILDATGDAAEWFDVTTDATLAAAVRGDASVSGATATVRLPHGDVDDALEAYIDAQRRDETAFRSGGDDLDPGEAEPGELPVVVGGERSAFGDADAESLSDVRGDLAFAYDYLIADAGTLGSAVAAFLDGVLAVTDTRDEAVETGRQGIAACREEGLGVVGAVLNRAPEHADVTAFADQLGVDVLAVVPDDDRPPAVEPVAFTAPEMPAALAYGRLADAVRDWESDGADDHWKQQAVAADGDGGDAPADAHADEEADDGGVLGRLADRFR